MKIPKIRHFFKRHKTVLNNIFITQRDKVKTSQTPEIRGFQTFQADFGVYLVFIAQKNVVVPCGSCGAATFFLPKKSAAHISGKIHTVLNALQAVQSRIIQTV